MTITKLATQNTSYKTNTDKPVLKAEAKGAVGGLTATNNKSSDIPSDISKDISSGPTKSITTDENGNTVVALNSTKGLKITRVAGGEECDGAPTRWEVSSADGSKRELTDEEKKALATKLDRDTSGHDLKRTEDKLARDMLHELVQDPAVDTRWDAPNLLKDIAMSEGKVTSRERTIGQALGQKTGPMEMLTLTNGNSAEIDVIRESAPNGPGSTPIFSKSIRSGDYPYQVKLSREEAVALRDNLKTQGPQNKDTIRDLDKYIRSLDPSTSADTFERTSQRNPYQRYTG